MPDFVNVPVPADRVQEVYALLAQSQPRLTNGHSLPRKWNPDLIKRMYRESPAPMKAFLRHLASHPGQRYTAEEMANAIRRKRAQLAGVLGAFGRRVSNRYGRDIWPFMAERNADERTLVYWMEPGVAQVLEEEVRDS